MKNLIDKSVNDLFSSELNITPGVLKLFLEKFSEECKTQAMTSITELIGEMSWGQDIPSPVIFKVHDPIDFQKNHHDAIRGELKVREVAVDPLNMEPVFEAIYKKLRLTPEYNAWEQRTKEYNRLIDIYKKDQEIEIAKLKGDLIDVISKAGK